MAPKRTTGEKQCPLSGNSFLFCSDQWFYIAVSQGCSAAERSGHPEDVGTRSQDETFADFHSHLHSIRQLRQRPHRGGRLPSPCRLLQTHRLFGVCSDFLSYFSDLHNTGHTLEQLCGWIHIHLLMLKSQVRRAFQQYTDSLLVVWLQTRVAV